MITAALAIARLTSLVAEDELTAPLRTAVEDWARRNPDSVLRDRLAYLTWCSGCVSVWAAGAVLIGQKTRAGRPLVAGSGWDRHEADCNRRLVAPQSRFKGSWSLS